MQYKISRRGTQPDNASWHAWKPRWAPLQPSLAGLGAQSGGTMGSGHSYPIHAPGAYGELGAYHANQIHPLGAGQLDAGAKGPCTGMDHAPESLGRSLRARAPASSAGAEARSSRGHSRLIDALQDSDPTESPPTATCPRCRAFF